MVYAPPGERIVTDPIIYTVNGQEETFQFIYGYDLLYKDMIRSTTIKSLVHDKNKKLIGAITNSGSAYTFRGEVTYKDYRLPVIDSGDDDESR